MNSIKYCEEKNCDEIARPNSQYCSRVCLNRASARKRYKPVVKECYYCKRKQTRRVCRECEAPAIRLSLTTDQATQLLRNASASVLADALTKSLPIVYDTKISRILSNWKRSKDSIDKLIVNILDSVSIDTIISKIKEINNA